MERSLLMLLLENHAIFLDFEWHLMVPENAQGKLHYFFMRQLNVGTKGLQNILRDLRKKGLVHRDDLKRGRSFAMRYLLTPRGRLLANELLKERGVYPVQKENFMRVLVKSDAEQGREEPLFAIKGGAIVSIDSVTIKKETRLEPIKQEYVFVKEDVVIVTKQVSEGNCKIIVKGLEIEVDPMIYEKAKRVCKVTEACEDFEYCMQTPLSDECFSSVTVLRKGTHTKKILKEWRTKLVNTTD
ncbi:MAG: hypothetical protein ACFFA5_02020 [Promethearchaeota archaeon]